MLNAKFGIQQDNKNLELLPVLIIEEHLGL